MAAVEVAENKSPVEDFSLSSIVFSESKLTAGAKWKIMMHWVWDTRNMSWLGSGISQLTGQISNFTKEVLTEGTEEVDGRLKNFPFSSKIPETVNETSWYSDLICIVECCRPLFTWVFSVLLVFWREKGDGKPLKWPLPHVVGSACQFTGQVSFEFVDWAVNFLELPLLVDVHRQVLCHLWYLTTRFEVPLGSVVISQTISWVSRVRLARWHESLALLNEQCCHLSRGGSNSQLVCHTTLLPHQGGGLASANWLYSKYFYI